MSLFPVTFATIDRIDVVRGGAAVQYGPNNVGGVINLISKPIPFNWENEIAERATFYGKGRNLWDTYLRTGGMLNDDFGLQVEANQVTKVTPSANTAPAKYRISTSGVCGISMKTRR